MFGGGYFGKDYFGGDYFPPTIGVIIVTKPKEPPSGPGGDVYTIRRKVVDRDRFEKDRDELLAQIVREDEEIIRIIIEAINSGVIR